MNLPRGIVRVVGPKSSGKKTFAIKQAIATLAAEGAVVWLDVDAQLDVEYATSLGLDVENPDFVWLSLLTDFGVLNMLDLFATLIDPVDLIVVSGVGMWSTWDVDWGKELPRLKEALAESTLLALCHKCVKEVPFVVAGGALWESVADETVRMPLR